MNSTTMPVTGPVIPAVKTYTRDEAYALSLPYFNGDELAAGVFVDKYALRDNQGRILEPTPDEMHHRLAREFARVERKFDSASSALSESFIYSLMKGFRHVVPQGSPMMAVGNPYQYVSGSNCVVVDPPIDSYAGICLTDQQLVQLSKRRCGVGFDLSNLRPTNTPVTNAARTSTGVPTWMERYSNSTREVAQKGRRGALMLTLSVHHPDCVYVPKEGEKHDPTRSDFVSIKRDKTKVTGANISVRLSDEFMQAATSGNKFQQRWPVDLADTKFTNQVDASYVWDKIVENAHFMAEPGLLFWDNILRNSPADCYADVGFRTTSTNPCSEICMSTDSCRLLLLNLLSYVKEPFTDKAYFDYALFYHHAQLAQRLMDDLVELELEAIDRILAKIDKDPEPAHLKQVELGVWKQLRQSAEQGRRTGLGITAMGDTLAALGVPYSSEDGIRTAEQIYRTLKFGAYRGSVDMAKTRGPFPVFSADKEKDCEFFKRFKSESLDFPEWNGREKVSGAELIKDMWIHGRRNIALLTTAPTGSVSIMTQTTGGIEPLFKISYVRNRKINPSDSGAQVSFTDQNGDRWQSFEVYHEQVKNWMKVTGSNDLTKSPWYGQCAEDIHWEPRVRLQAAATRHLDHAVSSTINLPEDTPVSTVRSIYEAAWAQGCKGITVYRKNCRTGVLVDKKPAASEFPQSHAPKRPKTLDCDVHHTRSKGEDLFVLVGLMNGRPYEIFAGKNGMVANVKKGQITKHKRGHYSVFFSDASSIDNICDLITDDQAAITRLCSLSLRHGAEVQFVVQQMEKVPGDMHNFARAMARILKKYIKDGVKENGDTCPNCNSTELQRVEGCVTCKSCGSSKCA